MVKGPVPTQPLAFLPQQDRERIRRKKKEKKLVDQNKDMKIV